ncbi:hypothetical protein AcW1_003502 [Taiwanofungus camphoratus]|nr:hypothetical protein AcV5_002035 [Antrodia cinnamomea]KAI0941683.1 hypothetical protein AcW1_003502 [Antrodia cinnamomea]
MKLFSTIGSIAILVSFVISAQVSFQPSGKTLTLGGNSYYVPPSPVSQFRLDEEIEWPINSATKAVTGKLIPFSVVSTSDPVFTEDTFEATLQAWAAKDDVWNVSFLTGVYILFNGSHSSPAVSLSSVQKKYAIDLLLLSESYPTGFSLTKPLPSGPYFLEHSTGNIFEAYRLYNDENQAFLYGTIPDGSGGYEVLSVKIPGAATETIGVPSRLYFTPTSEKPLAGLRVAVKDIYDVQGLRTGCGSRAYWALHPPKEQMAPAVQRLLAGGLVLVGKTKTSQFANGEVATGDWVDLHAPYNPRGDGYQDGSSSSTGSGTAMAAYPWLDYAIGTDTGGSMRGPAGVNGVFGNRPSHGAVSLECVMPLSLALDTAGIFSRDAKSWATVGHWWYQNFTSYAQFPKTILFPIDSFGSSFLNDPPAAGTTAVIFDTFITRLESFLGTIRTEINLTAMWTETKPAGVSASLNELVNLTYSILISTDQTSLVADPFMHDYAAANGGRKPFIDPVPLSRWTYGWSLPAGAYDEAIANKTIFMDWFASQVVKGGPPDTCSESILIYPQSSGRTTYRNAYKGPPSIPFGFSSMRIAVLAETPDMVVPVGETPYNSTVTGKTEYLPVTLSFVAAKGCVSRYPTLE